MCAPLPEPALELKLDLIHGLANLINAYPPFFAH
jgi:hypothetical protein